ncbi:AAA family ATPase [Ktedonobacter sp. SOSP1-52]|uniref:AAA family ATPase n=1 Tax=Ktedonobacter sp. SOSP1-52 TaxID=2778366 RepID=UPI002103327F|nr:AAA family ATPase [Ktedonobacter sp. SOSP1-52]
MGICSGVTGVGKTQAARRYSQWDVIEPRLARHVLSPDDLNEAEVVPRTAFYTPEVTATPKRTEQDVALLRWEIQQMADMAVARDMGKDGEDVPTSGYIRPGQVDLLMVDEANRLCPVSLEMLRDVFDRGQMGLVLVGRPGLERMVRSIAPLASRVGMRLEFAGLNAQELDVLLQRYIQGAGVEIDEEAGECYFSADERKFSIGASSIASN